MTEYTSKVEKSSGKFEKGHTKTGGRQKGTPNKKTVEFIEALGGFDPVEELKKLFINTDDNTLKAKICLELMRYIYPQRKAIDLETSETSTPVVIINREAVQVERL